MKVQTRAFVAELIEYIDHDAVSHSRSDVRYRPLAIDAYDGPIEKAIRVCGHPCDVEIVCDGGGVGKPAKAESKDA